MMVALVSATDLRSGAHWAAHYQDHRGKACVSPIHGKSVGHIWCLADAPVAGGKKVKQVPLITQCYTVSASRPYVDQECSWQR